MTALMPLFIFAIFIMGCIAYIDWVIRCVKSNNAIRAVWITGLVIVGLRFFVFN